VADIRRLGIYGGTFDPPHCTHIAIARAALDQAQLDCVLFIVAAVPPHKLHGVYAGPEDRFSMVEAALRDEPQMEASRMELDRQGPSYTADTVEALRLQYPEAALHLIIGSDSAIDLPRWRHPERILAHVQVLVVPRPGLAFCLAPPFTDRCQVLAFQESPTASSEIRRLLAAGGDTAGLVPDTVADVIEARGLYRARRQNAPI
jgi:nicotinate-nucleotide adenylyltransferase